MKAMFFWAATLVAAIMGCSAENADVAKAKAAAAKAEAELARIKADKVLKSLEGTWVSRRRSTPRVTTCRWLTISGPPWSSPTGR
jgi:hypothetical protein